jgi:hypothetical protein
MCTLPTHIIIKHRGPIKKTSPLKDPSTLNRLWPEIFLDAALIHSAN